MEVTDVRIKLARGEKDNLLAYCSVIFDHSFVVSDLRIVRNSGGLLVSMPSRRQMFRCPSCRTKNHSLAKYCNDCGISLESIREKNVNEKKLFIDTAHPIKAECRKKIVDAVLKAYEDEFVRHNKSVVIAEGSLKENDMPGLDDSGMFYMNSI